MSGCLVKRLITLTVPIKFCDVALFDNTTEVTSSSLFSWSTDGVCWTNFVSYDQYKNLACNIEGDYFLRILIITGFTTLVLDGKTVDCYTICLYNENPYLADLCANNTIDFYANLDCALYMYQQMSDLICCMIGIPVYYFRVLPKEDTIDLTFKEYILHNVVDMKYLKLVVPEGQMPSSKPQMTEFDFDWETDWEVEMSKSAFAKAFGDTAFPKQRDIIYIPMMKRMWEVNAAYDEKQDGFMWQAMTWKLGLVKWNDKTNIDQGDFESIIDNWATNRVTNEMPKEAEEQLRQSGVEQIDAPRYKEDNLYDLTLSDAVRSSVSIEEKNSVVERQMNHRAAVVTRNAYMFKNETSIINYQQRFCGDSGTLSFITGIHRIGDKKTIIRIGNINIDVQGNNILFNGMSQQLDIDRLYMVHIRWDRSSFVSEMNIYPYICISDKPSYMVRPDEYIFDFENPVCRLTGPYNNDFIPSGQVPVYVSPYPCLMTNIKLFDVVMDDTDIAKESIKYVTKNEHCVINDVARPFEDVVGFSVR